MNVSGTLHFYSGEDRELFFVFDDDVAKQLYGNGEFDIDDLETRRAYVSVGADRFIHRRTLSFSKKQTEIKISLCSLATKNGLGALTTLYDWFAQSGKPHPAPIALLGKLRRARYKSQTVWELYLTEATDLVEPPGLNRRKKTAPPERKSYEYRRLFVQLDLSKIGRFAEALALKLAKSDFPSPRYSCLWRDQYLDSERIEIHRMGVIADIDVWDTQNDAPKAFIEVKAQKVKVSDAGPSFYLSTSEWRSYKRALKAGIPYQIWLFQYQDVRHFTNALGRIELIVFECLDEDWLEPDNYFVTPVAHAGTRYSLE